MHIVGKEAVKGMHAIFGPAPHTFHSVKVMTGMKITFSLPHWSRCHEGGWAGAAFSKFHTCFICFKGKGTRDLIWLKVVSMDRSWLVGLTDDL